MKKVLVIVVTFNGMHWLQRCLSSVSDGGVPKVEPFSAVQADLYVWDNDSTDGSADFVAANFPKARLVRSADNLGFAAPNNFGMQYAIDHGYDYVYLLNQDAWLAPGALETLIATAEAHPEYAVLSPMQYQDGYQELDCNFARLVKRRIQQVDQVQPQFGPGPIPPGGPGPLDVELNGLQGISAGPGPGCENGPSPKIGWTRSKEGEEVEKVESVLGPRPCPVTVPRVMAAHWLIPVSALRKIGLFEKDLFPSSMQ